MTETITWTRETWLRKETSSASCPNQIIPLPEKQSPSVKKQSKQGYHLTLASGIVFGFFFWFVYLLFNIGITLDSRLLPKFNYGIFLKLHLLRWVLWPISSWSVFHKYKIFMTLPLLSLYLNYFDPILSLMCRWHLLVVYLEILVFI